MIKKDKKKLEKDIKSEGLKAQKILKASKNKGVLPPDSFKLYKALRRAGLDI